MEKKPMKALVLGMKTSGISACYLLRKDGYAVRYYDDFVSPLEEEFENVTSRALSDVFDGVSLVVTSPAIPNGHEILSEALKRGLEVISELEYGSRHLVCKKIVITGTNGKTTTTCMADKVLTLAGFKSAKLGNIGYPVSQRVFDGNEPDYAVIEASSFQLEYIKTLTPDIAVLTNVSPDHLDRYPSYDAYVAAKRRILMNGAGVFVYNADDRTAKSFADAFEGKKVGFGLRNSNAEVFICNNYYYFGDEALCHVREAKAKGEHNKYNLLCAMNIAALCGVKKDALVQLVREYVPLSHRVEYVSTIAGKSYYNDSKGTNTLATTAAVNGLDGSVGLIMGGSDKNEDYCDFFCYLNEKVKAVAVCGANAGKIESAALKMGFFNIFVRNSLAECVKLLSESDVIDSVLFSPAAASFDKYADYRERGNAFKRLVYEIKS